MLLAYMAGAPTGLEGGYSRSGQQSISTRTSHGRNSMQLLQRSTHGATSENARKYCFIVITKQYVIFGVRVHQAA